MTRVSSKECYSDPQEWNGKACDNKLSYARDNSVILSESPYRW